MEPILELRGITKRFPGVLANDHIDLQLHKGEILALLGENGAGKTTLMNILYGLYSQDEGEILINGTKIDIQSPTDAIHAGIGMVHQHFMLIPVFDVTENVMLGNEYTKTGGFLDKPRAAKQVLDISEKYNLQIDPNAIIEDLPIGLQQRVEIIKILFHEAEILIMDEPSAVLTPQEVEELFKIMRSLIEQGKSIIFITHKLREVMECADRIVVIRGGKVVGESTPDKADMEKLAAMMVGRPVELKVEKQLAKPENIVLEVENLTVVNKNKKIEVDNISFDVQAGEILGIAGVQGNGQTELVRCLTGLMKAELGKISILGTETTNSDPRTITELGVAHIPEDRQKDGLVLQIPVEDNLVLNTYYQEPFAKGIILQPEKIHQNAEQLVKDFDIRTPSTTVSVSGLSGGNQQKVIVAREFSRPIKLLIASQPTRGLDVGSIEYIHRRLIEKRDDGCAILLVSTELDEVMQLADRIAVMYRGKILAVVDAEIVTKEELGLLMAGIATEIDTEKRKPTRVHEIVT
ncbi:MAG: ABC transporter ATP-binding protein [Chloroflexota bacterium]|nr:ABC transporter ATP-binding protein [Chloroflexota bacterium]